MCLQKNSRLFALHASPPCCVRVRGVGYYRLVSLRRARESGEVTSNSGSGPFLSRRGAGAFVRAARCVLRRVPRRCCILGAFCGGAVLRSRCERALIRADAMWLTYVRARTHDMKNAHTHKQKTAAVARVKSSSLAARTNTLHRSAHSASWALQRKEKKC